MSEMIDLSGRSLLIVDDDAFVRGIVRKLLHDLGAADIREADDGVFSAALWRTGSGREIDCAISDFSMPRRDGLRLLKRVRAGEAGVRHDLPFVMFTGRSDAELVGAALALDVSAFLVKPVSKAALSARLTRALGDRRALRPAHDYANVPVPEGPPPPAPPPQPKRAARRTAGDGAIELELDKVPVGAVLAEPIAGDRGLVMLGEGALLEAHTLRRLEELRDAGLKLARVRVFPPAVDAPV